MIAALHFDSSKMWWGWLGILSHPSLLSGPEQYAVFFDNPDHVPAEVAQRPSTRFFYTFWDGLQTEAPLVAARDRFGADASLTALVVAKCDLPPDTPWDIRPLYPAGPMHFASPDDVQIEPASSIAIQKLKLKNLLMPLKNLTQPGVNKAEALGLLLGTGRIVFCGVYQPSREIYSQFSERHGADPALFVDRKLFLEDPDQSWANFLSYLERDGHDFADMLARGQINEEFFLTLVRVLQRAYFIERLKHESARLFTNGWTSGANINVYTTPFYRQHRFLDFGSMAGPGNYPRLADLSYFGKQTIALPPVHMNEVLRTGKLADVFSSMWDSIAPSLR